MTDQQYCQKSESLRPFLFFFFNSLSRYRLTLHMKQTNSKEEVKTKGFTSHEKLPNNGSQFATKQGLQENVF